MLRRKRKKTKTLILGDSLSSNIYAARDPSDSLLLSWIGASSTLDGWDLTNVCVDRLPLFLERSECLKHLGFEASETDYKYVLVGEEESLRNKISLEDTEDPQRTWYDLIPEKYSKVYKPVLNWCQIIKVLRSRVGVPRLYASIRYVDPYEKTVLLEGGATVEYENIVSSIPQDLLLTRLKGIDPRDVSTNYAYLPYSISLIIGRVDHKISDDEVVVYALGRKRYIASHVVLLRSNVEHVRDGHVLTYVLTPLRRDASKTEILIKNLSELKSIGIKVRDVVFARSYLEKYGRILKPRKDSYHKLLNELGIRVVGRYGSWEELSICDVIATISASRVEM